MIDPYYFLKVLSRQVRRDEVIVVDCGANLVQTFQAFEVGAGEHRAGVLRGIERRLGEVWIRSQNR